MRSKFFSFFLLLPFLLWGAGTSGSVLLHNDTTYILTAVLQASDGSYLGQYSVQPGEQRNFTTNLSRAGYVRPGTPDISLTPYKVIWQCPAEGIYAICTDVSPGGYVKASQCMGSHYCSPKEKPEQEAPPASTLKKK
jgi:hypothetical protein